LSVPSIQLDFKGFKDNTLFSDLARLKAFVREHRINLVQTFFQDPHLLGAILKCLAPVKLIGSFRDMGFWRTFSGTVKIRLSDFLYDGYIANSEAVKNYSSKSFRISPDKITRIYNGFHFSERPVPARSSFNQTDPMVVGIVAGLNRKVKRVHDFITMASIVRATLPDTRFVVIGDGNLKEKLMGYSDSLGLKKSISFMGAVTNPIDHIMKFDVGVLTSESEGFSNAIIEYMACGVPVVATDAGGNSEIVISGENGYLVAAGNPAIMAEKVLFLLTNPSHAREISRANREKVARYYTVAGMVEQHQAYYQGILAGPLHKDIIWNSRRMGLAVDRGLRAPTGAGE
jgi:glycosyltransferase involved in cell wall biosynthesis